MSSMKKIEKIAQICYNENKHRLKSTERMTVSFYLSALRPAMWMAETKL